ncbi:response regulator [Aliiroseovarius crassostreae]|uniref:Regulatory protein VirG n=1 Tax=Aliiroseovarius crassostreae TaxID=154981 RepID=A0A9Q9M0D0_9RHOB|nr:MULTISPECIES: response regulator [Aliiroseovarius]UWP90151.1 response regulator [Aliiroseovarius crassostreae]UWP93313.1 response regulator [Aliiroseovarius crassostreae]UWP96454.1 response regulator [Aliiroseovarius crassostreae]UWP99618.1 response regulator [Aliiroseovarius crassostreae]UWQ06141.1 response regulator [Aliiroseovarius crassostreae]
MAQHILIVEDDSVTRRRLGAQLRKQMYRVSEAEDAAQMEEILARDPADLLLVDINLDGKDGLTITREQRAKSKAGIILLTARDDQIDRIIGLEMGADDYVTKPFDKRELFARIKNLLVRISDLSQVTPPPEPVAQIGPWRFDHMRRRLVGKDGTNEPLTRAEFELLHAFTRHPGVVLSRDRLLDLIQHRQWAPDNRTIDVLVGRLRKKIETDPSQPEFILTVHGEGYLFVPGDD